MILQGTEFMKKLRWGGTLDGSGMMGWHSAVARWHVECGTGRGLGIYVIDRCEKLMLSVNRRFLQVGKKKSRPTARRRCWESEMGDVGVRNQKVEGMRIATRRKL